MNPRGSERFTRSRSASIMALHGPRLGLLGLTLAAAMLGTGCVVADVHTHGGSTHVVQQHSAGGVETQITRHRDGQTIITRDGSNTDVTVQRNTSGFGAPASRDWPTVSDRRFDWPRSEGGSRSPAFRTGDATAPSYRESESLREAYRRQMLDRMSR